MGMYEECPALLAIKEVSENTVRVCMFRPDEVSQKIYHALRTAGYSQHLLEVSATHVNRINHETNAGNFRNIEL